jgi:hypothetical protein
MGLAIAELLECHLCDVVEWQFAPHCSRSPRRGSEPADEDPHSTNTGADDPDQPIRPRAFFDDKLISGSLCYTHAVTPNEPSPAIVVVTARGALGVVPSHR